MTRTRKTSFAIIAAEMNRDDAIKQYDEAQQNGEKSHAHLKAMTEQLDANIKKSAETKETKGKDLEEGNKVSI